jgi:molecular chaperone GrpE (heat shock protein)
MKKWLSAILGKRQQTGVAVDEQVLSLDREVQKLRLELNEQKRVVANLKIELERQRRNESAHIADEVQSRIEQLLTDVAAPVTQLLTQAHLLEAEGKPVQAKDVLAVAKRLVRALEDQGLILESRVGEMLPFHPNQHELLNADASLKPGQTVVVRFVGATYQGKLLRKAGVEKAGD